MLEYWVLIHYPIIPILHYSSLFERKTPPPPCPLSSRPRDGGDVRGGFLDGGGVFAVGGGAVTWA